MFDGLSGHRIDARTGHVPTDHSKTLVGNRSVRLEPERAAAVRLSSIKRLHAAVPTCARFLSAERPFVLARRTKDRSRYERQISARRVETVLRIGAPTPRGAIGDLLGASLQQSHQRAAHNAAAHTGILASSNPVGSTGGADLFRSRPAPFRGTRGAPGRQCPRWGRLGCARSRSQPRIPACAARCAPCL